MLPEILQSLIVAVIGSLEGMIAYLYTAGNCMFVTVAVCDGTV